MLNRLFRKSHLFVKNNNLEYQRYFIKKEPLEHRLSIIFGARGVGKLELDHLSSEAFL
jgi:hypothetical protein